MSTKPLALLPFALLTATTAQSDEAAWAVIRSIDVQEIATPDSYRVIKSYPAEIANGVERFDITGFAIPTSDPDADGGLVSTLMLVSDMLTCPFCGLPGHAAALEVTLDAPLVIEEGARITLRGALELNRDPDTWQAATLTGATRVGS